MNVIIFEDELIAKDKLVYCINNFLPEANILGWGRTINECTELLQKTENVDLIFSDIQLIGGSAFKIFREHETSTPIIFCTAYDQFLSDAFETNGIAYLLKPFNDENFNSAIIKFKKLFDKKNTNISTTVLNDLLSLVNQGSVTYKSRFVVKKKEGVKLLKVEEIVIFIAEGTFCTAVDSQGKKHVINNSLAEIEKSVNPKIFFKINRSEIINIDYIESILPHFKNRLIIKLKSRKEDAQTSSSKTAAFRLWLNQ